MEQENTDKSAYVDSEVFLMKFDTDDYVLTVEVADKSTNLNNYMQKDKLEELVEAIKVLAIGDKFCFEINKVEDL